MHVTIITTEFKYLWRIHGVLMLDMSDPCTVSVQFRFVITNQTITGGSSSMVSLYSLVTQDGL